MARFAIKYKETYARTYYVEADTYEDACEKTWEAIHEGKVKAPDICIGGNFEDETEYHVDCLEDDDQLDVR